MFIIDDVKNIYLHIKYNRILKKVYKQENLLDNLSKLFNTNFKIDKIGRIYTVINPFIVNGQIQDISNQFFEYNENGFVNDAFIEKFIMDKLLIAEKFIHTQNLFELLNYDIKKIDDYHNYLLIIQPITLEDFLKSLKTLSLFLLICIPLIITIIFLIKHFFIW